MLDIRLTGDEGVSGVFDMLLLEGIVWEAVNRLSASLLYARAPAR
jgi:hypothetical protein